MEKDFNKTVSRCAYFRLSFGLKEMTTFIGKFIALTNTKKYDVIRSLVDGGICHAKWNQKFYFIHFYQRLDFRLCDARKRNGKFISFSHLPLVNEWNKSFHFTNANAKGDFYANQVNAEKPLLLLFFSIESLKCICHCNLHQIKSDREIHWNA